jgi:hypothetical protein
MACVALAKGEAEQKRAFLDYRRYLFYFYLLGLALRVLHLVASAQNPLQYMPVLDERYYVGLNVINLSR